MRRRFSVKGVDEDAIDLLIEIREEERRFTGAVIGDAIRLYHESIFEQYDGDQTDTDQMTE